MSYSSGPRGYTPPLNHIYLWSGWLGKLNDLYLRPWGVIPHPLPEVNFLMFEIPTLKPYIFMIRVTRKIKCLIAQAPGGHTSPLPEVNFLMVEIPTPKPYIFMIRVNGQIKCPKSWGPGSSPSSKTNNCYNITSVILIIYFLSSETWWYLE